MAYFKFSKYCIAEPAVNVSSGGPVEGDVVVGGGGRLRLSSSSSGSSYGQPTGPTGGVAHGGTAGGRGGGGFSHMSAAGSRDGGVEDTPVKVLKSVETHEKLKKKDEMVTKAPSSESGHALSVLSTPGNPPLPPNPPPTPAGGVGGVPIPPPPPPTLPGAAAPSHLKRVNWEKLQGTEGTIWKEVRKIGC